MDEQNETPVKASTGKSVIGSVIGTLICIVTSVAVGWYASAMYIEKNADRVAAEKAAAEKAARMQLPPAVETALVTKRVLNPPKRYIGHVESIEATDLRAQISGTIAEVAFDEGSMVKEGDLLFQIDPEIYEARVAQAQAALDRAKAASVNADRYYARMEKVDKRAVTEAEIDQAYADMLEARAAIAQCEADLTNAKINLGYTRITAPISGRIGASLLKKGDYVSPNMASLARIVQTDPVRVVFSLPDKQLLENARKIKGSDKAVESADALIRAELLLADNTIYEHTGSIDFVGNEMSKDTASVPVRYTFANPNEYLVANAYVTVLLSNANPEEALTIPTTALLSNAKGSYVYVLTKEQIVAARPVTLGAEVDGYVVIASGLEEGEEVITQGVVNVRPGIPVTVIKTEQPAAQK
ncbi:MAG: efflux RND transporter periplasmic adaptor subunit [bacterium]|nr:efflux RND transporter periplasmic adaptor subunit [bacterium]